MITIKIDNNIVRNIERLQYETESRKQIIGYMLSADLVNSDSFKRYQDEYKQYFIEFEKAKDDMEKNYILPKLENNVFSNWNLDFTTGEVTVEQ